MKKRLRSALAILLSPSIAQADDVTGKIALVDAAKHTITLTSGMTFFVAERISIVELIPGDDIEITFGRENGMLIAVKPSRSDVEA
jgi:Cu/Ag efflux protein CusF